MALYTTPFGGQVCLMTACLISSVIFPFTINKNAIIFYSEFLLLLTHANACQPVCLFVMKPLRSYIWYLSNVTCARVLLY